VSRAVLGLLSLLAAVAVHVALTLPARQDRDAARDAYARQRAERERLRAELARLDRRSSPAPAAPEGEAAAGRGLRLSLLAATRGVELGDVQIAATPERRGAIAARGRLSASGSQAELLRAAGRLAEEASGVRLERLNFTRGASGPRLEAEAVTLRSGP
jgi:hypothetical protein